MKMAPEIPEVVVREVGDGDEEPLRQLLGTVDAFRADEVAIAMEVVAEYRAGDRDYRPYILWEGSEAAGFLCYGPVPLTEATYDLYWVAVGPDYRGKGYGRRLMEVFIDGVRSAAGRVAVIETSSQPSHGGARVLYERCGFAEAARIATYYGEGDDLIIYTRHFPLPSPGAPS